jgi:HAD superfamily hydrolase (TIGR01509 family)
VSAIGVGFDIDHTLCIDNKLERVAFLRLLERVQADGGEPIGNLGTETEAIDALLAFQRGGGCTLDVAVERFARERGVEKLAGYPDAFRRLALEMAPAFLVPDPQARAMLAQLARRDVAVCVLSNGWNPLQTLKARRAGFGGDVLTSAELGVQKPDPAAFGALVAQLGVPAERCYYVGDDPKCDIAGAVAAGLRGVWLDNEGKTYPADAPAPTHTVRSLAALLDIIGETVPL